MKIRAILLAIAVLQLLDIKQVVSGLLSFQPSFQRDAATYQRFIKVFNNNPFLNLYSLNAEECDLFTQTESGSFEDVDYSFALEAPLFGVDEKGFENAIAFSWKSMLGRNQEEIALVDEAPQSVAPNQPVVAPSNEADVSVIPEKQSYGKTFNIQRMYLSYAGGTTSDTGYGTDYGTLGILLGPVYKPDSYLPLIDLRGHRFFSDNSYAANAGVVLRFVPPADDAHTQVWGVNAFFDYREGNIGDFPQLGLGFESLGTTWDFRLNTYIPLRNPTRHKKCEFNYPGGYTMINNKYEYTFYGANAEVGYYLYKSKDFILYGAAGPYGWAREKDESVLGGEIRIRPQYRDYIALDLRVTYDPIFETVFQGELIISFPLYQLTSNKRKMGLSPITDRQVYQRVERLEIIPYDRSCCWQANF